jgi:hypothetical protein
VIDEIESLASGECRWIGRHDVHVYCRAPLVETLGGWQPGPATYCVVCPDAGLEYGEWVDGPRAAKLVEKALKAG